MDLNRRTLLAALSAAGIGLTIPISQGQMAFAKAAGERRFVFIILRGGVDGLSMIEPRGDAAFAGLRGKLASANPLRLDGYFALHQSLPFVHKLFEMRQASFHHAIGTGYTGRSHFDAQNILESGGKRAFAQRSGWLNRLLSQIPNPGNEAIAVGQNLPLALNGPVTVGTYKLSKLPAIEPDFLDRLDQMYDTDPQLAPIWAKAKDLPSTTTLDGPQTDQSPGGMAAMLLNKADGARIATIELNGWDTHSAQNGRLSARLRELDDIVADLHSGLGPLWNETLVLIASEFGRTAAVNGTGGTDHGTGGAAMWLGGRVTGGGKIIADWPGLSQSSLFEARDLRTTQLIQDSISTTLSSHFNLTRDRIDKLLFP